MICSFVFGRLLSKKFCLKGHLLAPGTRDVVLWFQQRCVL